MDEVESECCSKHETYGPTTPGAILISVYTRYLEGMILLCAVHEV